MKIVVFIIAFVVSTITSFSQNDLKMVEEDIDQSQHNILSFQNISFQKVYFTGSQFKEKYFSIYAKQIWGGNVMKIDTIIDSKKDVHIGKVNIDTLKMEFVAGLVNNDKIKFFIRLPFLGSTKKYDGIANNEDYTLRSIGTKLKLRYNEAFPAFVYMLPYEKDGWKLYCEVADKNIHKIMDWGKIFNIKHYIVIEMKFED